MKPLSGSGLVPEDPQPRHLPVRAAQPPAGVPGARPALQHGADERPGAVRGFAGHRLHPQQGQHALHEHHPPLLPHGHLPEPGGGLGHGG